MGHPRHPTGVCGYRNQKFAAGQLGHFTSEAVVNNNIGNRFFSKSETDVCPWIKGVGIGGVERDG